MSDFRAEPTQSSMPPPAPRSVSTPAASVVRALSLVLLVMTVIAYLMAWAVDADAGLSYESQTLGMVVIFTMGLMTLFGAFTAAMCGWWLKRRGR